MPIESIDLLTRECPSDQADDAQRFACKDSALVSHRGLQPRRITGSSRSPLLQLAHHSSRSAIFFS